jgi:hypothetical protein
LEEPSAAEDVGGLQGHIPPFLPAPAGQEVPRQALEEARVPAGPSPQEPSHPLVNASRFPGSDFLHQLRPGPVAREVVEADAAAAVLGDGLVRLQGAEGLRDARKRKTGGCRVLIRRRRAPHDRQHAEDTLSCLVPYRSDLGPGPGRGEQVLRKVTFGKSPRPLPLLVNGPRRLPGA